MEEIHTAAGIAGVYRAGKRLDPVLQPCPATSAAISGFINALDYLAASCGAAATRSRIVRDMTGRGRDISMVFELRQTSAIRFSGSHLPPLRPSEKAHVVH